jgi:hypothetical protein
LCSCRYDVRARLSTAQATRGGRDAASAAHHRELPRRAKLKCGARDGRKAAELDAMTQRFMFKAKDKVGNCVPHTLCS